MAAILFGFRSDCKPDIAGRLWLADRHWLLTGALEF
jgi:hypothetical protein